MTLSKLTVRSALLLGVMLVTVLVACAPSTPEAVLPTVTPEESVFPTLAPSPTGGLTEATVETEAAREPPPTLPTAGASTEPGAGSAEETPEANPSHTVQPGETLLGLAMQYELPMAALQLANDLGASTNLWADQTLSIPATEAWTGTSPFWIVYEIQEGDTLTGITERYDLDFVGLVAVNELTDADTLSVGQPLILPLEAPAEVVLSNSTEPVAAAAPPEPTTATPEPVVEAAEATPEAPTAAPPTPVPQVSAPAEIAGWPGEVFRLINEQRAAAGLPPYTWNDTLALAAQRHGADCQQRGSCNHTGSDGSTVKIRVTRAGYPTVGAAECIVYSSSPAEAVAWWMDEVPPNDWHRRTLLSTWVTEVGVAVVPNHLGSYYFIADFGRPQ